MAVIEKSNADFFGITVDLVDQQGVYGILERFIADGDYHTVVTVNPDYLMIARQDAQFRNILNGADLRLIDGIGLIYTGWLAGKPVRRRHRFTGVALVEYLLKRAVDTSHQVIIVVKNHGDGYGNPEDIEASLAKKYPRLSARVWRQSEAESKVFPWGAFVFVALGAPQQDIWIAQHKKFLTQCAIAVGVGGTFDFLSGKIARAPKLIRGAGLEWLWRFIRRPKRMFGRVFKSVLIFPVLVLIDRLNKN